MEKDSESNAAGFLNTTNKYQKCPVSILKEWIQYTNYVNSGGKPYRTDKISNLKQLPIQPLVVVSRVVFNNSGFESQQIIGWRFMPLYNGDIVSTNGIFSCMIDFYIGARAYLLENKAFSIHNDFGNFVKLKDGKYLDIVPKKEFSMKHNKPAYTITRSGGAIGIKG